MYATGLGNVVKRDQAKALVYHTFAAFGGDTSASLTLGYRYLMGIGTEQSCQDALYYYKEVADKGEPTRRLSSACHHSIMITHITFP
jgi:SEL1 protein